jgi:hypothetical protein
LLDACGGVTGWDAALIDFQWCGWGLGATGEYDGRHACVDDSMYTPRLMGGVWGTDLAYLIASSASPDLLSFDGQGEAALLDLYYSLLCESLRAGGVPEERWVSRQQLTRQYETALVDLCRLVVAYAWPRLNISPSELEKNARVRSCVCSLNLYSASTRS